MFQFVNTDKPPCRPVAWKYYIRNRIVLYNTSSRLATLWVYDDAEYRLTFDVILRSRTRWPKFLTSGHSDAQAERQSARISKITNDGLTRSGIGCFIAVPIWQQ